MSQIVCPTCGIISQHNPLPTAALSTRFSELLATNTPPHDAEVDAMRQIVKESAEFVASLQAQMEKAQETLSSLQNLHSTALGVLAEAKVVLHPIRSLPRDILTEIFLHCTPFMDEGDIDIFDCGPEFDTLCPKNHPWNLSHVCQRWRDITISTPRLWSTIYLDFQRYEEISQRRCVFHGILLFERSGNLDLSLHVVSGTYDIIYDPLTSFLETSTKRWRTLTCGLPTSSLQLFSGCSFPLLRELGICYQDISGSSDTAVNVFNHAECLKTLNLYRSYGTKESYQLLDSFPCHQLTHMSCYAHPLESPFRSVLERSINIEELTLSFGLISLGLEPGETVSLPALKRIDLSELSDGNAGSVAELLSALRLPRICDLSLAFPNHYICFEDLDSHPNLHQITTLRIECAMLRMPDPDCDTYVQPDYMGGTETLLNFLKLMTGVEEFQLEDYKVSGAFLAGLVVDGDEEGIVRLPCLSTLDLHKCRFEQDTNHVIGMLSHVVFSRVRLGPQVKSFLHAVRLLMVLKGPCSALRKLVLPEKWVGSPSAILDSVEIVYE